MKAPDFLQHVTELGRERLTSLDFHEDIVLNKNVPLSQWPPMLQIILLWFVLITFWFILIKKKTRAKTTGKLCQDEADYAEDISLIIYFLQRSRVVSGHNVLWLDLANNLFDSWWTWLKCLPGSADIAYLKPKYEQYTHSLYTIWPLLKEKNFRVGRQLIPRWSI